MAATPLARRLGLDGNPLRRRTDKAAACFAALLLAMFLIGAPVLSITAIGWAGRTGATDQQAARSWHQVSAVLQQPAPSFSKEALGLTLVLHGQAVLGLDGIAPLRATWVAAPFPARRRHVHPAAGDPWVMPDTTPQPIVGVSATHAGRVM